MVTRYASLYFCMCIDADDNELEVLEIIHHFVEILDRYFGSVSASVFFHIHIDSCFHVIFFTVISLTS
jgi:AP-1 complex subunit sigma 1/2